jgi:hypothetical protein
MMLFVYVKRTAPDALHFAFPPSPWEFRFFHEKETE